MSLPDPYYPLGELAVGPTTAQASGDPRSDDVEMRPSKSRAKSDFRRKGEDSNALLSALPPPQSFEEKGSRRSEASAGTGSGAGDESPASDSLGNAPGRAGTSNCMIETLTGNQERGNVVSEPYIRRAA